MSPRILWPTVLAAIVLIGLFLTQQTHLTQLPFKTVIESSPISQHTTPTPAKDTKSESEVLNQELDQVLAKTHHSDRPLALPPMKATPTPVEPSPTPMDIHAQGRQTRKSLPMGIILFDQVQVTKDMKGEIPLYTMRTGDIIRVYQDSKGQPRLHIHPGVDVFLAATTQNIEAAGTAYPDQEGWVDRDKVQIFRREQSIEFTQTPDPMTLSDDPNFSMLSFYERALKNPDPVVHRIIGPRLLEIASLHEDYVSSWKSLYRDHDPKIRAYSLAQLRARGVGKSRLIVEDLINRLGELTQTPVAGEDEIEVLTIIGILKDSGHPRVPAAFANFRQAWAGKQSDQILDSLKLE